MSGWHREHRVEGGQTVLARAYRLNDRFRASVSGGIPSKVPKDVNCDDIETAKRRADELLRESYPHDCDQQSCGFWTPHGGP